MLRRSAGRSPRTAPPPGPDPPFRYNGPHERHRRRLQQPAPGLPGCLRQRLDRDAQPRPAGGRGGGLRPPLPREPDHPADPPELVDRPLRVRRPRAGLDPAPARRADPARPALEPGGAHGLDLRRPAAPRGRARATAAGSTRSIWVRGQGYDPLVPPGDPRAGSVRLEDEPGLRLPPEDDPDLDLWKARWEQFLRNRAVLHDRRRGEHRASRGPSARRSTGSSGAAASRSRSCSGSTCSARTGRGTRPSPIATSTPPPSPTSSRPARRGTSSRRRRGRGRRSTSRRSPVLIDVPAGAVGDVLERGRAVPAPADLRRDRHAGRPLAGRALRGAAAAWAGWTTRSSIFTSDQGEPLGEHGFVRRFRPWLYEELIHTPLIIRMPGGRHGGIRHQALVQTVDLLPTIALGAGPAAASDDRPIHGHDLLPLIRGEQTKVRDYACLGMDVEEFAIRTHLWHLIVPDRGRPRRAAVPGALPQARGPLGPEQRHRAASRGRRAPGANAAAVRRGRRPRRLRGAAPPPGHRAAGGALTSPTSPCRPPARPSPSRHP